jgi:hypothetical protein
VRASFVCLAGLSTFRSSCASDGLEIGVLDPSEEPPCRVPIGRAFHVAPHGARLVTPATAGARFRVQFPSHRIQGADPLGAARRS